MTVGVCSTSHFSPTNERAIFAPSGRRGYLGLGFAELEVAAKAISLPNSEMHQACDSFLDRGERAVLVER